MLHDQSRIKPSFSDLVSLPQEWRQHARYRGMLAHFLMIEVGGTIAYDIGPQHLQATIRDSPTRAQSNLGISLLFNGSDGECELPANTNINNADAMTEAAWVRDDATGTDVAIIYERADNVHDGLLTIYTQNASRELKALVSTSAGNFSITGPTIGDGLFHHVACSYSQADLTLRLYLDGREVASDATITGTWGNLPASENTYIGGRSLGTFNFDGIIDDLRIYDRELSLSEIESLWREPLLEFTWALRPRRRVPTSVGAAIPILAYHYNHHLGSMA